MRKGGQTEYIRVPLSQEKLKQIRRKASAPLTMSDGLAIRSFIDIQLQEL